MFYKDFVESLLQFEESKFDEAMGGEDENNENMMLYKLKNIQQHTYRIMQSKMRRFRTDPSRNVTPSHLNPNRTNPKAICPKEERFQSFRLLGIRQNQILYESKVILSTLTLRP